MPSPTGMTIDASKYYEKVRALVGLVEKSRNDLVKQEMGLLVGELIKNTAPFGLNNSGKKQGEQAVERDIGKVFTGMDARSIATMAKKLPNLKTSGKGHNVFDNNGVDANFHQEFRDRRGRVTRKGTRIINIKGFKPISDKVHVSKAQLKAYIKSIQAHVGSAKGGWMAAAIRYGTKGIPEWISRHEKNHDGTTREEINSQKCVIEAINFNKAISDLGVRNDILRRSFRARTIKLSERLKVFMQNIEKGWKEK
jgi:hypothetical protein